MHRASFILLVLSLGFSALPAHAADDAAEKKWYLGIGGGLGGISGPDWRTQDDYYYAQGYRATGGYGDLGLGPGVHGYGAWLCRDYLDLELGLTAVSSNHSTTYTNGAGGTVWSKRVVNFGAISASALLRPPDRGHSVYLKLGVHYSDYGTDLISVTGTVPNIAAVAAGDHIPSDAHYRGWGWVEGIGMDFGERPGFVRAEYSLYKRIGGTSENVGLLSASYHHSF